MKTRKVRSDKQPPQRHCNWCGRLFETKKKYDNHFVSVSNFCVRLKYQNNMKRIFEDDEEPIDNEYKSFKKHWMEMMKEQWDDSDKKAYLFENILTHRQVSSKKSFFDRLGDELNKEIG